MAKHRGRRDHPRSRVGRDQLARWRGQLHQPATMPGQGKRDWQRRPVPPPLRKMGQRDDNDTTERTP